MRETANVLSSITRYTALVMMPESSTNRLRHLQLVPLAEGYALVVVVTDAGVARDSVIQVPADMGADELDRISRAISQRYYNCRMSEVGKRMTRELGMELNDKGTFLTDLVETMETASGSNAHRIALSGTNNMLDYPAYGDIDRARQLLAAVEKKDSMYRLLKNSGPFEISVRIGSELGQDIFSDCSLVTATYRIGTMPVGTMGVIGPTRMPYGKVVSVLDYMSKSLGSILTNLLEED